MTMIDGLTNENWDKLFYLLTNLGELGREGQTEFLQRFKNLDKHQQIYVSEAVAQLEEIDLG